MGEPQMLSMRLNDTLYVPTEMLSWAGGSTVAWFLASHSLDLVRWLFDDEIERVYSVSRSRVLAARGINTPDFFQTICELKGGGVAQVENCWIMSEAMPTVFDFKAEFIGSEGTTFVDCSSHRMVQKYSRRTLSPFSSSPGTAYPDVAVVLNVQGKPGGFGIESIRHFVDSVVHGTPPIVCPQDGIMNTAALVALHLSAQTGQPVELASVL
jgi:predicted dehydrogenase